MPEARIRERLQQAVVRLRAQSMLWALAAAGALFAAQVVLGVTVATSAAWSSAFATVIAVRAFRRWTPAAAAVAIERADGSLENLAVTAAEILAWPDGGGKPSGLPPRPVRVDIRAEIIRQAEGRLASVHIPLAVPLTRPALVCAAVLLGGVGVVWGAGQRERVAAIEVANAVGEPSAAITALHVRVEPPVYSRRPAATIDNAIQVTALAGSTVRVEVESTAPAITVDGDTATVSFVKSGDRFVAEWVAAHSVSIVLRPEGAVADAARFLSILTIADASPAVRIRAPGKDLVVRPSAAPIRLEVEGADDLGLASMVVKFTRASGRGESISFSEGELPLAITRDGDTRWTGTARWTISGLALADGDVVVYRALARDQNPNGKAVQSESFVIEVGKAVGTADSGFAIPAEEKKYAISQQMVILKTEQLIANRASRAADWADQNRMLAIEQRMVRAEIVFLGGGEVEDEEVEAAASDELSEGRLQNAGRAEMLRAINAMSRAEAQLNDGRAVEALVFERAALKSLELAFDRRRYFLRPLSARGRIDLARRLTGSLADARPWTKDVIPAPVDAARERQRVVMGELVSALVGDSGQDATLAAHLSGIDPSSTELQQAAVGIAQSTRGTRSAAIEMAMRALGARARASLSPPADITLPADTLRGRLADELARTAPGRVPK